MSSEQSGRARTELDKLEFSGRVHGAKASPCLQGEGDRRTAVEGIVTRRKWDKTASFNPLSHGRAVTAPLVNKWSPRAINYHLSLCPCPSLLIPHFLCQHLPFCDMLFFAAVLYFKTGTASLHRKSC